MQIRILKKEELELLFLYSSQEGWNNEVELTTALQQTNPDDFFIAHLNGELLGFIVALKHSQELGFISSFLVLQEFRSLGYGKKLFSFALKHLGSRQIGLDSFHDKQDFYKRAGFKPYYEITLYKFTTGMVTLPTEKIKTIKSVKNLHNKNEYIRIMLLDKRVSYEEINDKTFAFMFKYKDGYKINIESEDINDAIMLFFALTNKLALGTSIYIQTTPLLPLLEALIELLNMSKESKLVRMYNKIIN